ncbi:MAG: hypothetical protein AB7E51_15075 [Pseudodesulfovibrio sp.]|uniref:hypothetical protein n=1 Tax=Pseudodesulfovibrio sp. TaxID=2035812 RepID=UPI003D1500BC
MKKITPFLAVVVALAMTISLAACASTTVDADSYPDSCYVTADDGTVSYTESSVILSHIDDPKAVKVAIGTAVLAFVATDKLPAETVLKVTDAVSTLISSDNSYSALASLLSGEVDNDQIKIVLSIINASGLLDTLNGMTSVSISDCDKALLEKLVSYINDLVEPYAGD